MIFPIVVEFFLNDGPVISDLIRFIIYSYLLFDCLISKWLFPPFGNSPLQAHILLKKTHPLFWCIQNKFSELFLFIHKYEYLEIIVKLSKISWLCCILGFGGVISRTITGITIFILSTTISGIGKTGVSHRWYVPTWTLLALIFTKFKTYSVDSLINRYIDNRYNVEPNYIIFNSGFSSKIIQFIALYTLFGAGINKLRNTGISWILPGILTFYVTDPSLDNYGILPTLRSKIRKTFVQYPCLVLLMSSTSLLFELTTIFGLFFSSTRLLIVIFACLLHFGIWIFITANYFPQCICYLMIIDQSFVHLNSNFIDMVNLTFFDIFFIFIAMMIIVGHVYSLIAFYEGWPFTSIPMYSLDRRQFNHDYLLDENQFYQLANEFPLLNGITAGGEDQFSEGEMWIRITKNNQSTNLIGPICEHLCAIEHAFRQSLWSAIMRSILISESHIDKFIKDLFHIMISNETGLVNQNDFINVQIHYRDGWKTYATSKLTKKIK